MTRWEYKTVKLNTRGVTGGILEPGAFDDLLNVFGIEGWELVTAFDTNSLYGASREAVAVFKRPRQG